MLVCTRHLHVSTFSRVLHIRTYALVSDKRYIHTPRMQASLMKIFEPMQGHYDTRQLSGSTSDTRTPLAFVQSPSPSSPSPSPSAPSPTVSKLASLKRLPYSGKFSWEKNFTNCFKVRFHEKNREFLKAQLTAPTILSCVKKIFARGLQFVKFLSHESFPAIQYMKHVT